tara:strand:+ start:195 stop:917 length:723 start_codon:yes stop_codon:yes gene_type:complete
MIIVFFFISCSTNATQPTQESKYQKVYDAIESGTYIRPTYTPLVIPDYDQIEKFEAAKEENAKSGSKRRYYASTPTPTPTPMPIAVNTGSINIDSEKNIQFNYMKSSLVNKNEWTVATNNSILNSGVSYLPAGFALLTDKDLTFLSNSLRESKLVDVAYLDAVHPELKNMWVEFYIPSLELQHHYFSMQIKNPGLLKDVNTPSGLAQIEKLYNGMELGIIWADWYDINAEAISDGWYNLK